MNRERLIDLEVRYQAGKQRGLTQAADRLKLMAGQAPATEAGQLTAEILHDVEKWLRGRANAL